MEKTKYEKQITHKAPIVTGNFNYVIFRVFSPSFVSSLAVVRETWANDSLFAFHDIFWFVFKINWTPILLGPFEHLCFAVLRGVRGRF